MESFTVSIVICTYNRPILFKSTLQSVLDIDFDPHQYEIIVIDNGNDHQSQDVFASIKRDARCRMSYAKEEKPGLSHARNKGIALSQGRIVVFLDDDELVDPNWLQELIKPYDSDERTACVGGRIIPVFPDNKYPSWYSKDIQGFFGGVDNGENIHEVNFPQEYIGGGNMSFNRLLILESGMFNVRLGIIGASSYSGEENELALRIRNKGFKVLYTPFAITYHLIERERISKQFFHKRLFQSGQSEIMYNPANQGLPMFMLIKFTFILVKSMASYIVSATKSEAAMMKASLAVYRTLGKISGCLKLMASKT
jgi:glycosyltransferase involved in cell wall biosynthesis